MLICFRCLRYTRLKKGIMNAYKKAFEETGDKNLRVLKAQWVDADFDEYYQTKIILERGRE